MESIGILCRGQSLERLPKVVGEFDKCFIVNDWRVESLIFEDFIKNKNIKHFMNADRRSYLGRKLYRMLGITEGVIGWTKLHEEKGKTSRGKNTVKAAMNKYSKELKMSYLPNDYFLACNYLNNTSLICLTYVARELRPSIVWIIGMDFYSGDYLVRRRGTFRPLDTNKMEADFKAITLLYYDTTFKLVTNYDKILGHQNLEVL